MLLPTDDPIALARIAESLAADQALNALSVQTDPDFERIIVDDGSKSEPARQFLESLETDGYAGLAPRIVRQSNRYLGVACNTAIAHASGSHVILLDDDNVPFPHFVATFRRAAARSRADIVTCQMHELTGAAPLGGFIQALRIPL
jgi:glycosyltransferase involved in cell wall biosynthesis